MFTEGVIITTIICITIIAVSFLIGYYTNKESKHEKLKAVKAIVDNFNFYYIRNKIKCDATHNEIVNMIESIKTIITR